MKLKKFEILDTKSYLNTCTEFYYASEFRLITNMNSICNIWLDNKALRETFSEYHAWLKENPNTVLEVYRGEYLTFEVKYQSGFKYRLVNTK